MLIDAIVRQTTVLIAQLATSAGARTPLAHTANQVFMDLVRELKDQGLGNKVIADMFGMALRTYHSKVRRLSESGTYGGRSLWEAVLEFVQGKDTVLRVEVLRRFRNDDPGTVRSVLKDLVETGMIFQAGSGDRITYLAASSDDFALQQSDPEDCLANLVWVAVNRHSPATLDELLALMPIERTQIECALDRLVSEERIRMLSEGGEPVYGCDDCLIPMESPAGWEAAVFDHYQALVTAVCTKLQRGALQATHGEAIGGSTYGYDVWPGHPHYEEALGLLSEMRQRSVELRARIDAHNARNQAPGTGHVRVISYVGQTLLCHDEEAAL